MTVRSVTPAEGDKEAVTVSKVISLDEGIRPQTTLESLAKLKPAFKPEGTGTAGNSSQISDGASAMTLARRDVAEALGLKPIARWIGTAVVGVPPKIMGLSFSRFPLYEHGLGAESVFSGVGPAYAIPALFKRFGITKDDVDIVELNEGTCSSRAPCFHILTDSTKRQLSPRNP